MKHFILTLLAACSIAVCAQKNQDMSKYLAGAVPVKEGMVVFDKTYEVPDKSKGEIYSLLKNYTERAIIKGELSLTQSRMQETDSIQGLIVAAVEEYLYFKRSPLSTDGTRMYYQLIYRVDEGKFNVEMRRIRYIYDITDTPSTEANPDLCFSAEDWITDKEALNRKQTKLLKMPGKFRRFTIDRKNQIFSDAAIATGAVRKVKMVEVYE
jgi:colicin import membrane protein